MASQSSVRDALGIDLVYSTEMIEALELWTNIYENDSPWLSSEIVSMNLGAGIASEIARSITIEMTVEMGDSDRADWMQEQFEPVMDEIRHNVEVGCAKGGVIFKPFVEGDQLLVDIVEADQFYPVSYTSSGELNAVIFVDQRIIGKTYYTRLEYHKVDAESGYQIQNTAYRSETKDTLGQQVPLDSVPDWEDLMEEGTLQGVEKPLFAYFKYPLANNIDRLSPLGVSCYSRATDLIKEADKVWSSFVWEFESGQRALYVDVLAFGKDDDGNPVLPHKRLYRTMETGSVDGDFYQEWSPDFREEDLSRGLDGVLKKIEFNCGLAYGTISDPNTVDKTATEIKASKQRSASTITDAQKSLEKTLRNLVWAMEQWISLGGISGAGDGKLDPVFHFDDSIIVDKDTQREQDLRLVTAQIIGRVEYRMRNFGEDEATAKRKIQEIAQEQTPLFGDVNESETETEPIGQGGIF